MNKKYELIYIIEMCSKQLLFQETNQDHVSFSLIYFYYFTFLQYNIIIKNKFHKTLLYLLAICVQDLS